MDQPQQMGPLHDKPLGDPSISASFADLDSARAARSALIDAGIDEGPHQAR